MAGNLAYDPEKKADGYFVRFGVVDLVVAGVCSGVGIVLSSLVRQGKFSSSSYRLTASLVVWYMGSLFRRVFLAPSCLN